MTSNPPSAELRKAVVIGGAGFLGQRLVACLLGDVIEAPAQWPSFDAVHVLDAVPFEPRPSVTDGNGNGHNGASVTLTSSRGDIRSRDDLRSALAGAHTVFHLASIVDVGLTKNPLIDAVNVEGTRNVVAVCQELGVRQLVYTSSEDVVLSPQPVAFGDETIPYPDVIVHDYVRTKIEAEKIVRGAHDPAGLATCSIRPVHLYGPHDPHAIKISLKEIASGKVPFLLGDGSARFDIVYVDNVAHAHLLAAARLIDPATRAHVGGEAFFIGEGNAPNYFDFIRPFAGARDVAMPTRHLPKRVLAVVARGMELVHRFLRVDVPFHRFHLYVLGQDFFFSNAKAERLLGYVPWVSPAEGLARTVAWIRVEPLDLPG